MCSFAGDFDYFQEKHDMKSILAFAALLGTLLLTSCNTISGMGDDIQAAGTAIKETAEETKEKITN